MPDRPLTIATYAAGASLAAITLVYVFGPTFFFDNDAARSSRASRKKGVVGLVNPANDCFINSILQALAGLPELRAYLIREVHRRKLDGPAVYNDLSAALEEEEQQQQQQQQQQKQQQRRSGKRVPEWMKIGLQQGVVTAGLKDMLDALNERPLYKKTISAQAFIRAVEQAFNTRISRSQQDAQEFLQVIVERLAEEYSAGRRVRRKRQSLGLETASTVVGVGNSDAGEHSPVAKENAAPALNGRLTTGEEQLPDSTSRQHGAASMGHDSNEDENVFPMEGKLESQVECSVCHFKPKPSVSSFLTLTLNVPQQNGAATTLNTCFDGIFKIEHIEDFKCDRCRLEHALQENARQLASLPAASEQRAALESDRQKLETALREDPENAPKDVKLPALASAPKRRITRHTRIATFPRLLVLHLSRSIWDPHATSSKNMAKVAFPETLPLGGLLARKNYRLLGVVTHKGGHHSGHYESFRRQVLAPPFSTRASLGTEGIYSLRSSPAASADSSPQLRSTPLAEDATARTTPESQKPASSADPPLGSGLLPGGGANPPLTEATLPSRPKPKAVPTPPLDAIPTPGLPNLPGVGSSGAESSGTAAAAAAAAAAAPKRASSLRSGSERLSLQRQRRRAAQQQDRWWRISDEKVKECKTSEVLGMQREVYLLFYEMLPTAASN